MSIRDISAILREEESKQQKYKDQQQQEEVSSQAYKLLSEGKTPLVVTITLNLREPEVNKLYREYWKLKHLYKVNSIYEEIGNDLRHIIELHRRSKKEGIGVEHVVKLLQLADEDNPFGLSQLERRRKWLMDEIHELNNQIERSKHDLKTMSWL
jgi:hypothetical protein